MCAHFCKGARAVTLRKRCAPGVYDLCLARECGARWLYALARAGVLVQCGEIVAFLLARAVGSILQELRGGDVDSAIGSEAFRVIFPGFMLRRSFYREILSKRGAMLIPLV